MSEIKVIVPMKEIVAALELNQKVIGPDFECHPAIYPRDGIDTGYILTWKDKQGKPVKDWWSCAEAAANDIIGLCDGEVNLRVEK